MAPHGVRKSRRGGEDTCSTSKCLQRRQSDSTAKTHNHSHSIGRRQCCQNLGS